MILDPCLLRAGTHRLLSIATSRFFARGFVNLILLAVVLMSASSAQAVQMQVEGLQDSLAGAPTINHCTLRKAIINANNNAATYPQCQAGEVGNDEIVFNLPGTITFALAGISEDGALTGDLDITESITIIGHPDGTTIDANDLDRIFDINPGNNIAGIVVTLRNIHITNGTGLGLAGAIRLRGATLNLENCTISNSFADQGDGGGIVVSDNGVLNMTNSTISGNSASFHAGAMVVETGTANITNSTITNNSSATGLTGGIRNTGIVNLRSTIVAGNTNQSMVNFIPNLDGTFTSLGYNVIGDLGSQPGNPTYISQPTDQVGVTGPQINLGPLQSNGGPTPTHALGAGSIGIDKGHSSGSTTDQRGLTRPCDLTSVANATGGDGGDAGAFEVQGVCAPPNSAPTAVDDSATILHDSGANTINVLTNDSDPDSDTLTITVVTQGTNGSVAITGGGTAVTYTPGLHFVGGDSFTYTISDGNSHTATATVNVTVYNNAPTAVGEAYNTNANTPLNVAAPGVLNNDSDPDLDGITAQLVSGPSHAGSFALNANGSFSYNPTLNYSGPDSFTYKATDGVAFSNTVTVNITVIDTVPPDLTAAVASASLWSPNHDLVNVGLSAGATDNSGDPVTIGVAVFSDEDDLTGESGDFSPDAKNIGPGTLRLRAERSGGGDGRVYLIVVTATDSSNNVTRACFTVVVPKSQSQASINSVNAQAAAAQSYCASHNGAPPAGFFIVGDGPVVGPKQ